MGKTLRLIFRLLIAIFILQNSAYPQHLTAVYLSDFGNSQLKQTIEQNATSFLSALNQAYVEGSRPLFNGTVITKNARDVVASIWKNGPFMCPETEIITHVVRRARGGYELRNIVLMIKTENGTEDEEGVLIFTPSGKIENLYFGLENQRYGNLLRAGRTVKEFRRRQIILDFIENYRTAYNRKDIDYIEKVFSDNALIIVGQVIEVRHNSDDFLTNSLGAKRVKLIHLNKTQYISNLKKVFKNNAFIKIGFKDIEIYRHPKYERIYGVTLRQNWTSSNYSDQGYLFLMIDFKDEQNPIIHVRTWQPEKYTSEDEVFSLGDFEIIQ